MRFIPVILMAALLSAGAVPARAASDHDAPTGGMTMPATNVYTDAMMKMHQDMMMESSGDTDVDFIKGMIPHHQGAIDMAEIALQKSHDPFVRKLATDIITAQKGEIAAMQNWLTEHNKPATE